MTHRHTQLLRLQQRIDQQIAEADAVLANIAEFNRQNPDEKPITGDDEPSVLKVARQREELRAILARVAKRIEGYG
jgi:hypothetical protein